MRYCTVCQHPIEDGNQFCLNCGAPVAQQGSVCENCGAALDADSKFCLNCGASVNAQQSQPFQAQSISFDAPPPQKRKTGLVAALIALVLVIAVGVGAGIFFLNRDDDRQLGGGSSQEEDNDQDTDDQDTDDQDADDGDTVAAAEDPEDTTAPAADTTDPVSEATEPPAEVTEPAVQPVYLNELTPSAYNGKLWTRGRIAPAGSYHTNTDAPACWSDLETPGYTPGIVKDNWGNTYQYGLHIDGSQARTYTYSFRLDGKYTVLSGTCACPSADTTVSNRIYNGEGYTKYFEVYGDGVLLFTSQSMSCNGVPEYFEIDITGVTLLTIQYPATAGPNEIATIFDGLLR